MELEVEASSESSVTFTELYAREFQPLVRLATLMTGRVEIARDVVQEAFVKLHVKWPGVRDPAAYVRRQRRQRMSFAPPLGAPPSRLARRW